jgi:TIR domain
LSILNISPTDKGKRKISVFYSYAHEDERFVFELEKQLGVLKRMGIITTWHDRKISPGGLWEQDINEHLESAQVIVLMVSADFVASDYCWEKEMVTALQLHELQKAVVVPIVLREVAFLEKTPFGKLQMLPKDTKPIVQWERADQAWAEVAIALGNVCTELQERADRTEDDAEARRIYERIAADAKLQQAERHKILEDLTNLIVSSPPAMVTGTRTKQDLEKMSEKWSAYIHSAGGSPGDKENESRSRGSANEAAPDESG